MNQALKSQVVFLEKDLRAVRERISELEATESD
jgi:hypothetical protein